MAGRPKQVEGETPTKERILEAARDLIVERGMDELTLPDIARSVGIQSPSVLLYHFGSKQNLCQEVLKREFEKGHALIMAELKRQVSPREKFLNIIEALYSLSQRRRDMEGAIFSAALSPDGPGQELLVEKSAPIVDLLENMLREECKDVMHHDAPVRDVVVAMMGSRVRASMGETGTRLFGERDRTMDFARLLYDGLMAWRPEEEKQ